MTETIYLRAFVHDSLLTFLFSICWTFFWQTNVTTRVILGTLLAILSGLVSLVISLDWCGDIGSSRLFGIFSRWNEAWARNVWRNDTREDRDPEEATVREEEAELDVFKGNDSTSEHD